MILDDPSEIDPDMNSLFERDQRAIYAGDFLHPCPDCGAEHALTEEMRRRGYHCNRRTRNIEEGF